MTEVHEVGTGTKLAVKKVSVLAPLPLSIARSALFSVATNGPMYKHRLIPTAKKGVNATITYTGPHLNMEHFRLWQALLFIAHDRGQIGGEEFDVPLSEVLRYMGKNYKRQNLKKSILDVMTELRAGLVTVISERVHYDTKNLIDVARMNLETRVLTVRFGEEIADGLLDREILRNDIARSRELKRHHLAIWLHGFISSQASRSDRKETKHTFSVDELRLLCGSQAKERRHFCEDLDRALRRLKEGDNPLVTHWDWDDARKKSKVIVTKSHTLVKLLDETKKTVAAKERRSAADRAAASRARVVL
ncbi:hypothetical protein ACSBPQ_10845 [Stenotrophomonas sp. JC08]|uniref:hypothetical protein n=1 Tax=Stenotrophomonas sp. JC08 TaxID=3445779 RepID=UPI003FA28C49